jgi:CheY-like chemotaxis protein
VSRELILVVEDNEANQMLARAVLELDGFEVRVAGDAIEARDQLREATPSLILMDLQLPGQDGLSFTRELRDDPATASIPIVALTAHAMTGDKATAIHAGCNGYIAKPIDTRTLGPQVRVFINRRAGEDRELVAH